MKLSELLSAIEKTANNRGLSKPYIVGGVPRDKLLHRSEDINDVDLTTGDGTIHYLGRHVSQMVIGSSVSFRTMNDGHSSLKIGDFKLDFASNFKTPGIIGILKRAGISNPTDMLQELYSRDFTCNTALLELDLKTITDPTGLAIPDIKSRILKTCLSPEITMGYNNKRIVRVVYLAGKLGFEVDEELKDWIKENTHLMQNIKPDYITKKLSKGMKYNPHLVVSLLKELGLSEYTPEMPS